MINTKIVTIFILSLLSACTTIEEADDSNKNAEAVFQKQNDFESFILYNKSESDVLIDYSICKSFSLKSKLPNGCVQAIELEPNDFKIGALKERQADHTYIYDDQSYNVHSFIFEDGSTFQSINNKINFPLQKQNIINYDAREIKTLRTLKEKKIIDDFNFFNGYFYILSKNEWVKVVDVLDNTIHLLTYFIDEEYYNTVFYYSLFVDMTLNSNFEGGQIAPALKVYDNEQDFFSIQGSNHNLKGAGNEMYTFVSFYSFSTLDKDHTLKEIYFPEADYSFKLTDDNSSYRSSQYLLEFNKTNFDTLKHIINYNIPMILVYDVDGEEVKTFRNITINKENITMIFYNYEIIKAINNSEKYSSNFF